MAHRLFLTAMALALAWAGAMLLFMTQELAPKTFSTAPAPAGRILVWSPRGELRDMPVDQFDLGARVQGYRLASPDDVARTNEENFQSARTQRVFCLAIAALPVLSLLGGRAWWRWLRRSGAYSS